MPTHNENKLSAQLIESVTLAATVAEQARGQWSAYRGNVTKLAEAVKSATKKVGVVTEPEKELMVASASVATSFADAFITFADAAFDVAMTQGEDTRSKAAALVRKVVKAAVDDTLEGAQVASTTTRMLELRSDRAWQTIYLPGGVDGGALDTQLRLSGLHPDVAIEVRTNRKPGITLSGKQPRRPLELTGSRPSLSIRLAAKQKKTFREPCSGLLRLSGDITFTVALLALPSEQ